MNFISNIFLWLLPLISIPLIIHLLNRRKIVQIDFGSIYFLESLKTDSMKRINILQWLLLAIRTFIILLIILMMSRPILKGYYPLMQVDPGSSMSIIVIDDSFSLNGSIDNESRLALINKKYNQVLDSFDEKSQICIISLSEGVLYDGINVNLPDLSRLIAISNKNGELYKYVNIINEKFDDPIINKEVFIITDGQANLFTNLDKKKMADWNMYFVLIDELKSNLKINYAKVNNSIIIKDKIVDVEVEIENNSLNNVENNMVNIFINDVNVGLQNISIDAGKKKKVVFSTVFANYNDNIIKISLSEDDNNLDNDYYLNIYIPNEIKVLSVFNRLENTKYISNVIDVINKKNAIFDYDAIQYLDLSYANLKRYDVIVIHDYEAFEFHYNYFEEYLNSNNHLILFPEYDNDLSQLYGILEFEDDGEYVSLENNIYEKVNYLDFASYAKSSPSDPDNKDFMKVFKYIESPINSNSIASIGDLNSFWDKVYFANSKIDVFFTAFHLDWNEFPLKGGFIQFIKELLYSNYNNYNYNKHIGESHYLNINNSSIINKVKHLNPNGDIQYISLNSGSFNVESIKNPGLHEFYNDSYLLQSLAVNIEPAELSSRLLTNKEINALVGHDCYFFRYDDSVSTSIINNREGYELWRYLLWILCFMIIIEMLVSNGNRKA